MSEQTPNVYNANKEWHKTEEQEFVSADSLFVPNEPKGHQEDPTADTPSDDTPWDKRYKDLKKHHDRTVNELRQQVRDLQAKATVSEPGYKPPKTAEEIAEYAKDNPELTEVVETIAHSKTESIEKKLAEIEAREKKILKREAEAYLNRVHPDFPQIKEDPDFHNWAAEQTSQVQDWIYRNPYDGESAATAITLYKAAKGITTDQNAPEAKGPDPASLVPTRNANVSVSEGKKIWSRREIAKLSPAQYEKYEDEIDAAVAEGRITA